MNAHSQIGQTGSYLPLRPPAPSSGGRHRLHTPPRLGAQRRADLVVAVVIALAFAAHLVASATIGGA